jgi:hypothetical protein
MRWLSNRAPAMALALATASLACAGCHESDLEPQSPLRGDWTMSQWAAPVSSIPMEAPAVYAANPAPILYRPRSISLGYIGDEPLTPTPYAGARWPWVQEGFHMAPAYAYGYGYGYGYARRGHRRR